MLRTLGLVVLAAGILLLVPFGYPARADDWPQYRRDAWRTGASRDRLHGPLVEIWSVSGIIPVMADFRNVVPLAAWMELVAKGIAAPQRAECAVWRGRAFFFAADPVTKQAYLVSADVRTGATIWRYPLQPRNVVPSAWTPPVVSTGGVVFFNDTIVVPYLNRTARRGEYQVGRYTRWPVPVIRAVGALDARPLGFYPLPLWAGEYVGGGWGWGWDQTYSLGTTLDAQFGGTWGGWGGATARLSLTDRSPGYHVFPPSHAASWDWIWDDYWRYSMPWLNDRGYWLEGTPLVQGNDYTVLSNWGLHFRWNPGSLARSVLIAHPVPEDPRPEYSPPARFLGYPMALTPGGMLVADDNSKRFMAVLGPGAEAVWHRDIPWTLGVPAVDGPTIFTGAGGTSGSRALIAIDAGSGVLRWSYAPMGMAPDRVNVTYKKTVSRISRRYIDFVTGAGGRNAPLMGEQGTAGDARPGAGNARRPGGGTMDRPDGGSGYIRSVVNQILHYGESGQGGSLGLVAWDKRVFGMVGSSLVGLEQETGRVLWSHSFLLKAPPVSFVGFREHLLVLQPPVAIRRLPARLTAIRMDTGKVEWSVPVSAPGALSAAHGLAFVSTGTSLHMYGPAERTYRMAVDSPSAADYRTLADEVPVEAEPPETPKPEAPNEGSGVRGQGLAGQPNTERPTSETPALGRKLADATVLRLTWGEPLETMLQKLRARRQAASGMPMLLSMEWLDPTRTRRLGPSAAADWTASEIAGFARVCGKLAEDANPAYFEIAPDINVYLARYPERLATTRQLILTARQAVYKSSSLTKTLISFNVEVLAGTYGRGSYFPYGKVDLPRAAERERLLLLAADVDAVGLTSCPQAALLRPAYLPADYLLPLKDNFRIQPLLLTRVTVTLEKPVVDPEPRQMEYLKRLLQASYWMNFQMVAYPDALAPPAREEPDAGVLPAAFTNEKPARKGARPAPEKPKVLRESPTALRVGEYVRPAQIVWQEVLAWKRVESLTSEVPDARAAQ